MATIGLYWAIGQRHGWTFLDLYCKYDFNRSIDNINKGSSMSHGQLPQHIDHSLDWISKNTVNIFSSIKLNETLGKLQERRQLTV